MKMRLVSMAGEILPLAGLFIGNALADIFVGAFAAVLLAVGVVLYNRFLEKRWANFAVFSVVVSAVFAFTALVTEDSLFIKIQPTLFNAMFSTMLLGGWLRGKAVMKLFFGAQFSLREDTWRLLSLRWGLFFLSLVIANEFAWRMLDDDGWVTFKVMFVAPATGLFMLAQLPATLRGQIEPNGDNKRK
tara:strand:- start:3925 stop:4488 length:564 start_codon:yes stop_codon:yes gene_type:complete